MKISKKLISAVLAAAMTASMSVSAFAVESGFADVADDAWYAEAVEYVYDSGLVNGTGDAAFSPDEVTSRAMLAAILYRASSNPQVSERAAFTDVPEDAYYADAVAWAAESGVMNGYGDGLFGADDAVSREQIATILWRYAGSPAADRSESYEDEGSISAYAADAVDWAREAGIMSGTGGNYFEPQASATRAQVAMILYNYNNYIAAAQDTEQDSTDDEDADSILVVYFSASGNTEAVAEIIAGALSADIFELVPVEPYTDDDLDWMTDGSRVNLEHDDISLRDIELVADTVENWDAYDTVFIGYPIWWGIAAWPVDSFVTANDFTGKTVIPFCTSSSSGIGQSGELLAELAGSGDWQEGQRFRSSADEIEVTEWLNVLSIDK
ncbi:MAG: S-layer homology domain-containing protein [Lachnospiraceae bacterium]|nr:S-layer homology domain-containing protein [Lachnospiraceae bacterium]